MTEIFVQRLEKEMKKQGFNYKSLSLAAGLGETSVRDIITRRSNNPRRDTLSKLAATLGKPLTYFLVDEYTTDSVPLVGEITPDRTLIARANLQVAETHGRQELEHVETPPELGHRNLMALRVRGNALYPFMPDGTLVYYSEAEAGSAVAESLGSLCIVQLKAGPAVIRKIRQGSQFTTYTLEDHFGDSLEDQEIDWCAKVRFIKLP